MATAGPLRRSTTPARVRVLRDGEGTERTEPLATEEPMEIRVQSPGGRATAVAVTMRTPGADFELAAGYLWTEGILEDPRGIRRVSYCEDLPDEEQHYNVVTVEVARAVDPARLERRATVNSSCGICSRATLEEVEVACAPVASELRVSSEVIAGLPDALLAAQPVFARTGGLHAAGFFDADGTLRVLREDIGRHNAVDKVVGWGLLHDHLPLADGVLQVSGRVGFEIVQKAAMAGIPIISAVGAPSSLAVAAAERLGVTVCGFVREGRATVYAHPDRIA